MLSVRSSSSLAVSRCRASGVRRVPPARSQPAADGSGWLDLTKLVTGGGGSKSPYDDLAAEIGKQVN